MKEVIDRVPAHEDSLIVGLPLDAFTLRDLGSNRLSEEK